MHLLEMRMNFGPPPLQRHPSRQRGVSFSIFAASVATSRVPGSELLESFVEEAFAAFLLGFSMVISYSSCLKVSLKKAGAPLEITVVGIPTYFQTGPPTTRWRTRGSTYFETGPMTGHRNLIQAHGQAVRLLFSFS